MSTFKFFKPFTWFQSSERAQYLQQIKDNAEQRRKESAIGNHLYADNPFPGYQTIFMNGVDIHAVTIDGTSMVRENCTEEDFYSLLALESEFDVDAFFEGEYTLQDDMDNDEDDDYEDDEDMEDDNNQSPCLSVRLSAGTLIATLVDGTVLVKENATQDDYVHVKENLLTEDDVLAFFTEIPDRETDEDNYTEIETEDERLLVLKNKDILTYYKEFSFGTDSIYLDGIQLPMPASVAGSFIELCEKMELAEVDSEEYKDLLSKFEALKMFWYWTSLNPIESSRRDLLSFVRRNDIKITRNGLLEMYRRVVSVGKQDKQLVNFVSNQVYRVKSNKRNIADFVVVEFNGAYLLEVATNLSGRTVIGNLETLYNGLPSMQENHFTDNHTRSMTIKIGEVYKEDEDKINLDNTVSCGAGLHVGSRSFMFGSFGDTGVLALVNPSKVRSVPRHECNKMRVSEMFIVGVVSLEDYSKGIDEGNVNDFSQEYFNTSAAELKSQVDSLSFAGLSCQGNVPALSLLDMQSIKDVLMSKVLSV